jgi:hypothetical protein
MKRLPIDKMLCRLERRANFLGVKIDADSRYVFICEAVTAFEFGEQLSYAFKENIYFKLRELFQECGLDFNIALAEILMGE